MSRVKFNSLCETSHNRTVAIAHSGEKKLCLTSHTQQSQHFQDRGFKQ